MPTHNPRESKRYPLGFTLVTLLSHKGLDPAPAVFLDSCATTAATSGAFSLNRDEVRTVRVVLERAVHRRGTGLLLAAQFRVLGLVELEGKTDDLVGSEHVALTAVGTRLVVERRQ